MPEPPGRTREIAERFVREWYPEHIDAEHSAVDCDMIAELALALRAYADMIVAALIEGYAIVAIRSRA